MIIIDESAWALEKIVLTYFKTLAPAQRKDIEVNRPVFEKGSSGSEPDELPPC